MSNARWIRAAKGSAIVGLSLVLAVAAMDILCYWLLPDQYTRFARGYRLAPSRLVDIEIVGEGYPPNYFQADTTLGFDIAPSAGKLTHKFSDTAVVIWSNDIGCFDYHNAADIKRAGRYDYLAGDSFTWGYADFDSKYGTVYERESKRLTLKCGTTHTGQLHQLEKFRRTVKVIGFYPTRVIVGYYVNDPANDHAHPHSTVIDGYLVSDAQITRRGEVVRTSLEALTSKVSAAKALISPPTGNRGRLERTWKVLRRYSISSHLLNVGRHELLSRTPLGDASGYYPRGIYDVIRYIRFDENYSTSPYTKRNRAAIDLWIADSKSHGYQLMFLLIPDKYNYANTRYFTSLREFLKDRHACYLDMTHEFFASGLPAEAFYWEIDGHWSNAGNAFAGQALSRHLSHLCDSRTSPGCCTTDATQSRSGVADRIILRPDGLRIHPAASRQSDLSATATNRRRSVCLP